MVQFIKSCRTCFLEKGQTIPLKKNADGEWICPKDASHKYKEDIQVA